MEYSPLRPGRSSHLVNHIPAHHPSFSHQSTIRPSDAPAPAPGVGRQQQSHLGDEVGQGGSSLETGDAHAPTPTSSTSTHQQKASLSSAQPQLHPSPINFDLALGLGTPYQAFAGDESLNFLDDFGYSSGIYPHSASEPFDIDALLTVDRSQSGPSSILPEASSSSYRPAETDRNPGRSSPDPSPQHQPPPIPDSRPSTRTSPDSSRSTSPHISLNTSEGHTDSGTYRPGDIEVEAPLKKTEGERPEIGLDSFRWAIRNSLSRSRGEGAFPQAYKPPADLPDWHRATDWEFGIGTPVMPPPPSSTMSVTQQPHGQRPSNGFATPQQYTSPQQQSNHSTPRHRPDPPRSAQNHTHAIPSPSMSNPSPSALPAIIAQPPHLGSMLIPALHPGMHRPLPSPNPQQHGAPSPVIMGIGQQAYRPVQPRSGTVGITSRSPGMAGQPFPGAVSMPNTQGRSYAMEHVASSTHHQNNSGRSSGKRRVDPEVMEMGNDAMPSPSERDMSENGDRDRKKKKPRVALSCAQCTKRKQRCNREIPCQHCTARRIPEQCTPYIPGQPLPPMPKPPRAPKGSSTRKGSSARVQNVVVETGPAETSLEPAVIPKTEAMSPIDRSSSLRQASPAPDYASVYSPINGHPEEDDQDDNGQEADEQDMRHEELDVDTRDRFGGVEHRNDFMERLIKLEDTVFHDRARAQLANSATTGGFPPGGTSAVRGHPHLSIMVPDTMSSSVQSSADELNSSRDRQVPAKGALSRSTSAGEDGSLTQGESWLKEMEFASKVPTIEAHRGRTTTIKLNLTDCGTPSDNLQRLIEDCGVSPQKLEELLGELPDHARALALIDQFFAYINKVRYAIDEAAFREAFTKIYDMIRVGRGPEAGDVRSLPLIFIVLATSVMSAPEEIVGDEKHRKNSSLRLYWCSRRSILIATSIIPDSLELVLTRLLSALYLVLVHDRRLTECWSQLGASLRTAQAIGMHRDGTKLGLDPKDTENRRRIWAYLYHADRHYSLILGRPPSIIDSYVDAKEPSNVELSEIQLGQPIESRPLNQPTSATFAILRLRFAKITGKIAHHFQALDQPATYEAVQQLDNEILTFVDDLPSHYRMVDPDTSLDVEHDYIIMHRYIICTEILFMRIVLHRPWVLLKLKSDRYAASRKAAFEAARMDSRLRQALHQAYKKPVGVYFTSQFREFNAAMMAGIAAILSPRGPDAAEMRLILSTFLQRHPLDDPRTKDAASKKEVQIIRTLHDRARQVSAGEHPSDSVALLLGLRGDSAMATPLLEEPGNEESRSAFGTGAAGPNAVPIAEAMFPNGNGSLAADSSYQTTATPPQYQHNLRMPANALNQPLNRLDSPGQLSHSPSSALSHEDDRPQRLLNEWLSHNNVMSLAGGGGGELAPGVMTSYAAQHGQYSFSNQYMAFAQPTGWEGSLEPFNVPHSAQVGHAADVGSEIAGPSFQMQQQDTFHAIPSRMAQSDNRYNSVNPTEGLEGLPIGMDDPATYWNALIDGIFKVQES